MRFLCLPNLEPRSSELNKSNNWGGPRKNQTGRPPKPEAEKHVKRQISLPPDVSMLLDQVPTRQRSKLIAKLLSEYFANPAVSSLTRHVPDLANRPMPFDEFMQKIDEAIESYEENPPSG